MASAWREGRAQRTEAFADFTTGARLQYQSGLDGVRGIAAVPVVMFHLQYIGVVPGAELAMSLFFTLSGFLITTLVLHEHEQTGRFSLSRFWATRARRILPPAWIMLAGVGLIRLFTDEFEVHHQADTVAAFLHVSNWYVLVSDGLGEAFFDGRSPVFFHTWSLSIEEQFYVAIALGAALVLVWSARPVPAVRELAIGGALVSFLLPFMASMDRTRVFFSTDTRAGELLVGVAMATVLLSRAVRLRMLAAAPWLAAASSAGFVGAVAMWRYVPTDSRAIAQGLLPVASVVWMSVIVGAMLPIGPVAWLTRRRLLQRIGRVSYGVYLYHLPIIVLLASHTTSRTRITIIAVPATLVVAGLSYRFVELPVRRRQITGRPLAVGAGALAATIVLTIVVA